MPSPDRDTESQRSAPTEVLAARDGRLPPTDLEQELARYHGEAAGQPGYAPGAVLAVAVG
jgi:hypothetical protein